MKPFTAELMADMLLPASVQLSPDGGQVVYVTAPAGHAARPASTVWIVPADGSAPPRPLTDGTALDTTARWSPDGGTVAFLSNRAGGGGMQVFRVSAQGSQPVQVTSVPGDISQFQWLPDGSGIAFTARRASLLGEPDVKRDVIVWGEQWQDRTIATIPASGGGEPTILGPSRGHVWTFSISPDGQHVAAMLAPTADPAQVWSDLRVVLFHTDAPDVIHDVMSLCHQAPGGIVNEGKSPFAWSDDSRTLCILGPRVDPPIHSSIFLVDVATRSVRMLEERAVSPQWVTFHGDLLLVQCIDRQESRFDTFDPASETWETVSLGVDGGWVESPSEAGNALAFVCSYPEQPAEVYVSQRPGRARKLTDLNPAMREVASAVVAPLSWTGADGWQIDGWLVLPPGPTTSKPLPLIVQVHGGPANVFGSGFGGAARAWGQVFAARGYAVLMPNPRGSLGRGGEFARANRLDLGGKDFQDIMAGVDALIQRGIADPERLGIYGWSFGGFMTKWAVTQTDRFKAAVSCAGPSNWVSKIGTTDHPWKNAWYSGDIHLNPDVVWEKSPIRFAPRVKTPTLLVGGDADEDVPIGQSMEFYLALRAAGVPTELVVYRHEKHSFSKRSNQIDVIERACAWFERYLGAE